MIHSLRESVWRPRQLRRRGLARGVGEVARFGELGDEGGLDGAAGLGRVERVDDGLIEAREALLLRLGGRGRSGGDGRLGRVDGGGKRVRVGRGEVCGGALGREARLLELLVTPGTPAPDLCLGCDDALLRESITRLAPNRVLMLALLVLVTEKVVVWVGDDAEGGWGGKT